VRLDEQGLNVVLHELLGQRLTTYCDWVHSIVDSNLAVFVLEKVEDVLSTFLEDLLAKQYRGWRGIDKKVVMRDLSAWSYSSTAVVSEMKDASLDTKPAKITGQSDGDMCFASRWETDSRNHYPARMEESAGFGAVELGRSHALLLRQVMNRVDKCT